MEKISDIVPVSINRSNPSEQAQTHPHPLKPKSAIRLKRGEIDIVIYMVCGKTDMRREIGGLVTIVTEQYELDIYSDALFLFYGGQQDRFKALYWEDGGFSSTLKRFENVKLRWLLEGLSFEQKKSKNVAKTGFFHKVKQLKPLISLDFDCFFGKIVK